MGGGGGGLVAGGGGGGGFPCGPGLVLTGGMEAKRAVIGCWGGGAGLDAHEQ